MMFHDDFSEREGFSTRRRPTEDREYIPYTDRNMATVSNHGNMYLPVPWDANICTICGKKLIGKIALKQHRRDKHND